MHAWPEVGGGGRRGLPNQALCSPSASSANELPFSVATRGLPRRPGRETPRRRHKWLRSTAWTGPKEAQPLRRRGRPVQRLERAASRAQHPAACVRSCVRTCLPSGGPNSVLKTGKVSSCLRLPWKDARKADWLLLSAAVGGRAPQRPKGPPRRSRWHWTAFRRRGRSAASPEAPRRELSLATRAEALLLPDRPRRRRRRSPSRGGVGWGTGRWG